MLHSDNGSPMKVATFLSLLEKFSYQSFFQDHEVSKDKPYSEAVFRTPKYCPDFPHQGLG